MCNLYTQTKSVDEVARLFREMQVPLSFPEGLPNLTARDIRITETAPIVRGRQSGYELVMRRWSWPGNGGKPVYNFRSDGREFSTGRCLIIADGFYEFTIPQDPKQKRKDRWLFSWSEGGMVGIAGLTRDVPDLGEAFTMLTTEPGPDVARYHQRQVALVPPTEWRAWLDYSRPASELLKPLPEGSLSVCSATG
ncbi:MAG TPA: SOS response-associated peptidase family protein [Sphingomicrobium sp.]|jgi:putative SOS response-associated peptidase YedK